MGSKSQVTGYKYYMPMHIVSCLSRGPTAAGITVRDCMFEFRAGDRTAWSGAIYENGTISVNAPDLFGGDEKEGGVVGSMDVMFGAPDQGVNAYLTAQQGDPQSAHRGLFSLVWKGGQVCSNNPYLKPWAVARRRITGGWYGECWYPEKAPIPLEGVVDPGAGAVGEFRWVFRLAGTSTLAPSPDGIDWTETDLLAAPYDTGSATIAFGRMLVVMHNGGTTAYADWATPNPWISGDGMGSCSLLRPRPCVAGNRLWVARGAAGYSVTDDITAGWTEVALAADLICGDGTVVARFVASDYSFHHTANGGSTWTAGTTIETSGTPGTDDYAYAMSAAGAGNGRQAVGGNDWNDHPVVWWSNDGFATKHAATLPAGMHGSVFELMHVTGDEWLAFVKGPGGGGAIGAGAILRSIDGCQTFTNVLGFSASADNVYSGNAGIDRQNLRVVAVLQTASGTEIWQSDNRTTWTQRTFSAAYPPAEFYCIAPTAGATHSEGARYCMNPAHIIYQCLTDPNCLGYPTAVIDDASFTAAADQLYAEGLGLNLKWANRETIENFIGIVCDHAGMILLKDRRTGLYKLRLLRDDYNVEDLRVFTPSNSRIVSLQRPSPADIVNELQVTYTDYKTFKEATIPVRDAAAVQAMGRIVSKSHSLTGLPTESLAVRCGDRDLAAMTQPLWRIDLSFLRDADDLEPGEPFVLDYSYDLLSDDAKKLFPDGLYVVLRVADEINYGNAANGSITAKCVQDVFSLPLVGSTGSLPDIDDGSPGDPVAATALVFEATYRDLAGTLTASDLAALPVDAGYIAGVAVRPNDDHRGFTLATRIDPAAYADAAEGLFSPSCTLSADIAPGQTVLPVTGWTDMAGLDVGEPLIIGSDENAEWVRVDAIAGDGSTITVGRGCVDTVPKPWPSGTRLWAYDAFAAADTTQYIDGETIDAKVLPRTSSARMSLADAALIQTTMAHRAARPLPPGGLLLNDAPFYDVGGPVIPSPPGGGGGGGGSTTPTQPPALDKYGNPASSSLGPNGGFADDSPDPIPQPEVFGTDIIGSDGEFGDPGALANWRNNDGSALSAEWSIDSGRLRYHGRGTYAIAVHWPSRLRMATQPSAGAIVSVAATVQTDGFGPPAGGSPVGATIGTDRTWVQIAGSYPAATDVTFEHDYQIDVPGVTAYGVYNLQTATPCVAVYNPAGDLVTCWWDDFTAEVSDPEVPMTPFAPANIDFPSDDLTGWVTFAGLMDEDIAGGELRATCTDAVGGTRYYINTDEIPVTDVGQRIRIRGKVWSNDPTTTLAGADRITANGVALGIALRDSVGNYYYSQYAYVFQRGDWTPREWWQEVTTVAGVTYHALLAIRAGEGYTGGIRDIEIDYTTDPVTR